MRLKSKPLFRRMGWVYASPFSHRGDMAMISACRLACQDLLVKSVIDAWFLTLETSNTSNNIRKPCNDDAHGYVISSRSVMERADYIHTAWGPRCSFRCTGSSKASSVERATIGFTLFPFNHCPTGSHWVV